MPSVASGRSPPGASNIFWLYSILLDDPVLRDPLMAELAKVEIETRPLFYPVHVFPMYRQCRTDAGCEVACNLSARGINLPTSSYLIEEDIEVIAAELRRILNRFGEPIEQAPFRTAA